VSASIDRSECQWDGCTAEAVIRREAGGWHTDLCKYHDEWNESLAEGGYSSVNPSGPRPKWHNDSLARRASEAVTT
jgi:hypothetical protein